MFQNARSNAFSFAVAYGFAPVAPCRKCPRPDSSLRLSFSNWPPRKASMCADSLIILLRGGCAHKGPCGTCGGVPRTALVVSSSNCHCWNARFFVWLLTVESTTKYGRRRPDAGIRAITKLNWRMRMVSRRIRRMRRMRKCTALLFLCLFGPVLTGQIVWMEC